MVGTIGLVGLRITCVIGTEESERRRRRGLEIDVEADLDLLPAAAADDLGQTIDYRIVATRLQDLADRRRFRLIETFAVEGAALLLDAWPQIRAVRLVVRKARAIPGAECSFVRLERRRA